MKLNEMVNYELLTLVNVLLHSSYQFILLRTISMTLNMEGCSWITEKKDDKCRDAALKILNWIQDNNGYLDLADISKPNFDEIDEFDAEFIFKRWDMVEQWIKSNVENIREKIQRSEYERKSEVIILLELILTNVMSNS